MACSTRPRPCRIERSAAAAAGAARRSRRGRARRHRRGAGRGPRRAAAAAALRVLGLAAPPTVIRASPSVGCGSSSGYRTAAASADAPRRARRWRSLAGAARSASTPRPSGWPRARGPAPRVKFSRRYASAFVRNASRSTSSTIWMVPLARHSSSVVRLELLDALRAPGPWPLATACGEGRLLLGAQRLPLGLVDDHEVGVQLVAGHADVRPGPPGCCWRRCC